VPDDRARRIVDQIQHRNDFDPNPDRLCQVCADVVMMSGAGIMLMSGDTEAGSLCSSNPVSALIEDLQFSLGEGPCVDAYKQDIPVMESDLARHGSKRWVAFTPPALENGVRAVFGFPMRVGAIRLGAVNLYRDRPGALTDDQRSDAIVMAGVAARTVLGMSITEVEFGSDLRHVVHQAAGMVSAQLDSSISEAMSRLRGHAFANDESLDKVAHQVISHELRFDRRDECS
jgi:GAF domain-containing protein